MKLCLRAIILPLIIYHYFHLFKAVKSWLVVHAPVTHPVWLFDISGT